MSTAAEFTYREARSGAVTVGLSMAIAIETAVVHLWLGARHPAWAWSLTALSVGSLLWLAAEYRAMGRGAIQVTPDALELRVGRRASTRVPRGQIRSAAAATWRDLPEASAKGYLNATAPAEPNVLVTFVPPARVRLGGGLFSREISRLGLRLDDPSGFLHAVKAQSAT
jgi:hypothetical protein